MSQQLELLQKVSLFSGLTIKQLAPLENVLVLKKFPKDAVILRQENRSNNLFVIYKGRVKAVMYGDNGREIILNWYGPSDFFGEMSLLDDEPPPADVVSLEPTEVFVLDRNLFLGYLSKNPAAAINILSEVTRRLRHANEVIGNLALLDVYGRVARVLEDVAQKEGDETPEGIRLKGWMRHQDIASMAGTSRESVTRVMLEFEKRGLIIIDKRNIILRQKFLRNPPSSHEETEQIFKTPFPMKSSL